MRRQPNCHSKQHYCHSKQPNCHSWPLNLLINNVKYHRKSHIMYLKDIIFKYRL